MRVKQKYYKGNYLIGIYTNDYLEQCVAILDNLHEFSDFMNMSTEIATITLHRLFHGVTHNIIINNQKYRVYFINCNDF